MSKHKKTPRIDPLSCALPAGGIDTHAHLNDPAFSEDLGEVLKRAAPMSFSTPPNFPGTQNFSGITLRSSSSWAFIPMTRDLSVRKHSLSSVPTSGKPHASGPSVK